MGIRNDEKKQKMGEWLNGYKWDRFGSLTFRQKRSAYSALKAVRCFIERYDSAVDYFIAVEPHRLRDCVHAHFLARGLNQVPIMSLIAGWSKYYGTARIYPYICGKGAPYYLSKYMGESSFEWDINISNPNSNGR